MRRSAAAITALSFQPDPAGSSDRSVAGHQMARSRIDVIILREHCSDAQLSAIQIVDRDGRDSIRGFEAEDPTEKEDLRFRCGLDRLCSAKTVALTVEHDQRDRQVFAARCVGQHLGLLWRDDCVFGPCKSRIGAESRSTWLIGDRST